MGIPVAVKLSPFYTAPLHFARRLVDAGADGLVVFNRYFEPDIDVEALEIVPRLNLSTPTELLLRLRWLAILSARVATSFAITGGVHSGLDAIKAVMCGADAVQLVSLLLQRGVAACDGLRQAMVGQRHGSLRHLCCAGCPFAEASLSLRRLKAGTA